MCVDWLDWDSFIHGVGQCCCCSFYGSTDLLRGDIIFCVIHPICTYECFSCSVMLTQMCKPASYSTYWAVKRVARSLLVDTYPFPTWLSSFNVAPSADIISANLAFHGKHRRRPLLSFLKNVMSSILNCTVRFVLFLFLLTVYSPI